MRVAAIDCGTNSLRILIADAGRTDGAVRLTPLHADMRIARLGEGVDSTGRFSEAALGRAFTILDHYAERLREFGVERVRVVATSASRDAANRQVFVDGVRERVGVEPEVISGDEEARLSFLGAASAAAGAPEPILVVDLGGGSTELVLGESGHVISAYSMDVGSVRMRERHLHSDPPTVAEVVCAQEDVRDALDEALEHVDVSRTRTLIGVAGTITSVTAEVLKLDHYDRSRIDGAVLKIDDVVRTAQWFIDHSAAERALLPHLHRGRIDTIGAGALVEAEVLRRVQQEVREVGGELTHMTTSEHDILDGLAMSLVD